MSSRLSPEEKAELTLRQAKTGEYIKRLRSKLGISLVEAGDKIGITSMFLSEIERGNKMPSDVTIRNIANFYKVNEDELFDMLGKVPLSVIEEVRESDLLRETLSKIRTSSIDDEKKERLYERLYELYSELEEDE